MRSASGMIITAKNETNEVKVKLKTKITKPARIGFAVESAFAL